MRIGPRRRVFKAYVAEWLEPRRLLSAALFPGQVTQVGSDPESVVTADFNDDGKLDLATANAGDGTVSIALGNGDGTFATAPSFAVGSNPRSIISGDFNGDGKTDLAIANYDSSTISILLNTTSVGSSTPSFAAHADFTVGSNPQSVTTGDFNGDGKTDLAVANYNSNTVSILLNTTSVSSSTPSFAAHADFTVGSNPQSVTTGDFNGDGKTDLAVANTADGTVSILLNTMVVGSSAPSFAAHADFTVGALPYSVTTGDFNGDGKTDLAVTNIVFFGETVSILLNTTVVGSSTPSFATHVDFTVGAIPYSVTTGDFNGDGKIDLAVPSLDDHAVSILLNTTAVGSSAPSFATRANFTAGGGLSPSSPATSMATARTTSPSRTEPAAMSRSC